MTALEAVNMDMSLDEAERITEQIVGRIDSISENYEVVMMLMRDALARNAHSVLGYVSPGSYIKERFGQALESLGASIRREFVHELSDAGLSTRAIAPVFGVSHMTIQNDRAAGVKVFTPPAPLDAIDRDVLEAEAALRPEIVNPGTGEIVDAPVTTEHTFTDKTKTTVGLDGKSYSRPEPRVKPVLAGDELARFDAEKNSRALGDTLTTLFGLTFPEHRERLITLWWPLGQDIVPPTSRDMFTPKHLRDFASALTAFATELENR